MKTMTFEPNPPSTRRPTRRTFLKGASAGAAALGLASTARAASPPLSKKQQFLLDRITFGRTPEMATKIRQLGYTGFLEWQLDHESIDDSDLLTKIGAENPDVVALWGHTPYTLLLDPKFSQYPGAVAQGQSPQMVLLAGHYSQKQLLWVMTDFLQNVHNTFIAQPFGYIFWMSFLRDVVHANALGNYRTLVEASGKGGSMMLYLGQFQSNKDNPNENYARELLELHTVGIKDLYGYATFSEADMFDLARALTGWNSQNTMFTPNLGDFYFDADAHDTGDKTLAFLPATYPGLSGPAGVTEGEDMMTDIVAHPLCALHVAYRMIQWFLGDQVEERYEAAWIRTATAFHLSGGDLRETVRELFNEAYYDQIALAPKEKARRPVNAFCALKRATNAKIDLASSTPWEWIAQLYRWGQVPGWWPAPNGYQPKNQKWTGSMQPKVEFLHDTFFGDNGLAIDEAELATIFPATLPLDQYAAKANDHVLSGCLPAGEQALIQAFLDDDLPAGDDARRWALFLTFAAPSFQYLVV